MKRKINKRQGIAQIFRKQLQKPPGIIGKYIFVLNKTFFSRHADGQGGFSCHHPNCHIVRNAKRHLSMISYKESLWSCRFFHFS